MRARCLLSGLLSVSAAVAARDAPTPAWLDTPASRIRLQALLQDLNADLLGHDSATLTLERWCGAHRLAAPARIVARRVHEADRPLPDDLRAALHATPGEPVAYRRVALACGDRVLSEADNWYLPRRLTPAMNDTLSRTDTPFGKVVQPLHFHRSTLVAQLLWSPLHEGVPAAGARSPGGSGTRALAIPHRVLQHRAVLASADGRPFSVLVETYTGEVLSGPAAAKSR